VSCAVTEPPLFPPHAIGLRLSEKFVDGVPAARAPVLDPSALKVDGVVISNAPRGTASISVAGVVATSVNPAFG
jgi:hypothetical protein